jgi:hypothetical protein
MSILRKKQATLISPVLVSLLFSLVLAGCSSGTTKEQSFELNQTPGQVKNSSNNVQSTPLPSSSPEPENKTGLKFEAQDWVSILPNQAAYGLKFTDKGALSYQDKILLPKIPVSQSSDGSVTYAKRLIVSTPSPSGNFHFVKACEEQNPELGLCWTVFLVNKNKAEAKQVDIAKYGGIQWVNWSKRERYAVLAEPLEESLWFVAVDLEASKSGLSEELPQNFDLNSFEWIDDKLFQVKHRQCDTSSCEFRGDVEEILNKYQ